MTYVCKESNSNFITIKHPTGIKFRLVTGQHLETQGLNDFLEIWLKLFLKYIAINVINDLDLLIHLPKTIIKDTIILFFDVINLYTKISHPYGLEALNHWIQNCSYNIPDRIIKIVISELLKFIYENNFFHI